MKIKKSVPALDKYTIEKINEKLGRKNVEKRYKV